MRTVACVERRKSEILVIHVNQRIRVSFDVRNEEVVGYFVCFPKYTTTHKLLSLIFMLHLHTRTTLSKSESFEVKYVYVLMLRVCTCVCVRSRGRGGGGNNGHPNP
jgi:hypothetical protein